MVNYIFTVANGIQVEIEASTFREAYEKYENIKEEVSAEKVKIVNRPTVRTEKRSLKDHILELQSKSFFDNPRTLRDIHEKLSELALHYPITSIPSYINPLVRDGILKRTKGKRKDKEIWLYENG